MFLPKNCLNGKLFITGIASHLYPYIKYLPSHSAVTSVRFNEKEEKVLNILKEHFHCDTSTLLKKSLFELYEDLKDNEIIEEYELSEQKNNIKFTTIDDILS